MNGGLQRNSPRLSTPGQRDGQMQQRHGKNARCRKQGCQRMPCPQQRQRCENRTVIDVDVTATPSEQLLIGGELNIGSESEAAMVDGKLVDAGWLGFMLMGHYNFNETFGLTGRIGSFSDDYGIRTGMPQSKDLTYTSITVAPTVSLGEGMGCLLEIRMDSANEQVWLDSDGKATDSRMTAAFEVTYGF